MLLEESIWIKQKLEVMPRIKSALDIGSSTLYYRTVEQPHIDDNVFAPLREKGVQITYLDRKKMKGIDIVCDIAKERFSVCQKYDLVLCTSLLEHVDSIGKTCTNISSLVNEGGYLIVTAPYFYPYHPDPIDNTSRFHIDDLRVLFPDFDLASADFISADPRNILFRIYVTGASIINAIRHKKLTMIRNNIEYLFKTPKIACTVFHKRSIFNSG